MRTFRLFFAGCAALVMVAAPFQAALAAKGRALETSQIVRTQARYSSGSVEAAQIRAWLEAHAAYYASGDQIGDPGRITGSANGTILVEKIRSLSSGTSGSLTVMAQEPPVPLPGTGNSGDVISIIYSVGPYTYSWTYQWFANEDGLGGKWVLIDYEMHFDPDYRKPY